VEHPVGSVGHIRIVGTLGAGGMGEVYVGWDETLERRVALKSIRRAHRLNPTAKARFLREARVLSQLDHPNICRIYDYVEGTDRDFLVLELVEGETLSDAIGRGLDDARRLEIAERIASALAAAHAKGVVHRDLKPHNVMLAADGAVKVLDFGIARSVVAEAAERDAETADGGADPEAAVAQAETLFEDRRDGEDGDGGGGDGGDGGAPDATELLRPPGRLASRDPTPAAGGTSPAARTPTPWAGGSQGSYTVAGSLLGSPRYMSPEQARGEPATTASDMYGFGLLLQELFTGRPPHPTELGVAELLRRARRGEHLPLTGVRSDVAALVGRLLDPAPAARPTAVDALDRLRWIRDTPRRRVLRAAIAAVVLVLVLGGVKYTLDLKAARDVAERHRAQAEDLIGFMLGDLKDKLSGVGRLELLEDVGDKALAYYESLPVEDRTDDELFRRSKALRQIGEVRIAQGELPAAMEAFDESERLAEELVERDPRRGEWLLGLGHSHFWQGNVHWLEGDLPAALGRFESYGALAERLVRLEPDEPEWRLEVGYAATNLAAVHEAMGRPDPALAALRRSLVVKEELLADEPGNAEWRRSLANGLSWQGSMLVARGDLAGAAESFERERAIRRSLLGADADNADAKLLLAVNSSHSGALALMRGDLPAARRDLGEAHDLHRSLVAHDPENLDWRRDLAVSEQQLADLALVAGDAGLAGRRLAAAREILDELVAREPGNTLWRWELARAGTLGSRVALMAGRTGTAVAEARAAQERLEVLLAESPDQRKLVRDLAASHLALGEALAARGEDAQAEAAWDEAAKLLAPLVAESRDVELVALRARALLNLGRHHEAAGLVERLTAAGYARPDLVSASGPGGRAGADVGDAAA